MRRHLLLILSLMAVAVTSVVVDGSWDMMGQKRIGNNT
jgi:hypothetical protein